MFCPRGTQSPIQARQPPARSPAAHPDRLTRKRQCRAASSGLAGQDRPWDLEPCLDLAARERGRCERQGRGTGGMGVGVQGDWGTKAHRDPLLLLPGSSLQSSEACAPCHLPARATGNLTSHSPRPPTQSWGQTLGVILEVPQDKETNDFNTKPPKDREGCPTVSFRPEPTV